jgi:hypothetical protein
MVVNPRKMRNEPAVPYSLTEDRREENGNGIARQGEATREPDGAEGTGGGQEGQDKLESAQAKKRADALLRDLGAAVYAERTGRGTVETVAETERLLAELRSHEAAQGTIDTEPKADQQDNAAGAAGKGSFTLDEM